MKCEQCGGDTWDNTTGKFWGNGLDQKTGKPKARYACKNKEGCGWKGGYAPAASSGSSGAPSATARHSQPLGPLYNECLGLAGRILTKQFKGTPLTPTVADYLSATATLFIAATRDGTPLLPPKPAVDRPKAMPQPVPDEPDPYSTDDGLPFD